MTDNSPSFHRNELPLGLDTSYQLCSSVSNKSTNASPRRVHGDMNCIEELNPELSIQSNTNDPHESISSDISLESPRSAHEQDTAVPHIIQANTFADNFSMLDYVELDEPAFNYAQSNALSSKYEIHEGAKKGPASNNNSLGKSVTHNDGVNDSSKCELDNFCVDSFDETLTKYDGMDDDAFAREFFSSPPPVVKNGGMSRDSNSHQIHVNPLDDYELSAINGHSSTGYETDSSVVDPLLSFDMHQQTPGPQGLYDLKRRSDQFNHQATIPSTNMANMKEDFGKGLGIYLSPDADLEAESVIPVRRNEPLVGVDNLHVKFNYPRHFLGVNDMMNPFTVDGRAHDMLRVADHANRSQSISKMPLSQMYAMMGLAHNHNLAKEREERVINIVRAEGFNVGSQTWIRDTEETERFRIINSILYQCKSWGYDKSLIEIIVRRGTYSRMQSKLRQERRMKKRTMDANNIRRYPNPGRSLRYSQPTLQQHLHQQYMMQQQQHI